MGQTADLAEGIAADLDAASVGRYLPDGTYDATDTAIFLSRMPADPDKAITLTAYVLDRHPDGAVATLRLQTRCRGDRNNPLDPQTIDDAIQGFLNGLTYRSYGSCEVNQITLFSSIPLGSDDLDRWSIATNWTVDTSDPTRE